MLSALVVDQDEMKPGKGFFTLAKQLGRNTKDHDALWIQEVNRLKQQ
jgi:hypothetical protein